MQGKARRFAGARRIAVESGETGNIVPAGP
jgi:hypothetical protein